MPEALSKTHPSHKDTVKVGMVPSKTGRVQTGLCTSEDYHLQFSPGGSGRESGGCFLVMERNEFRASALRAIIAVESESQAGNNAVST